MKRVTTWAISALVVLGIIFLSLFSGEAQSFKLVNARLVDQNEAPLANQSILVEGTKQPGWSNFWGRIGEQKVKLVAITDRTGYAQLVDLPPGAYTMKLVRPGAEPLLIKSFRLEWAYKKFDIYEKLSPSESLELNKWSPAAPPEAKPSALTPGVVVPGTIVPGAVVPGTIVPAAPATR